MEHDDREQWQRAKRILAKALGRVREGVQHAHQKAIIHRDLKPSNILVTDHEGEPLPKIIDFGVAKATSQKLTDETMHTQLEASDMNPGYPKRPA